MRDPPQSSPLELHSRPTHRVHHLRRSGCIVTSDCQEALSTHIVLLQSCKCQSVKGWHCILLWRLLSHAAMCQIKHSKDSNAYKCILAGCHVPMHQLSLKARRALAFKESIQLT